MSYKLFLDDVRNPTDVKWVQLPLGPWKTVRSYLDFKSVVNTYGLPSHVSFDHDLAPAHYDTKKWSEFKINSLPNEQDATGYECALWLIEYCRTFDLKFPTYTIHSMNPVGRDRIEWAIRSFLNWQEANIK